jgi:hypothetical protein
MPREWIDFPPRNAKHLVESAERGSDAYFRKELMAQAKDSLVAVDAYDKKLATSIKKGRRFKT